MTQLGPEPSKVRAAVYIRTSSRESQARQDPETQRLAVAAWLAQQGITDVVEYVDQASANDERGRKAWRDLMARADAGGFDLVVFWRLDRIGRSVAGIFSALARLDAAGVAFRSVSQPEFDTVSNRASSRLLLGIAAVFAEFELETTRERIAIGLDRAREQGKRLGRPSVAANPAVYTKFDRWYRGRVESGQMTREQAAKKMGVSEGTVRKLLARTPSVRPAASIGIAPEAAAASV